ncbi:MAG: flavin reductase family protein [Deltaproteobacteria bacterium]|nr:flavin reductase family protein [Deltaproteobacteria bacterium]
MKKSLGAKTILYPTPVLIVGTYDAAGRPNVMTAAWGGICCSSPPCVAVSLRKATYTYGNIVQQGGFTINIPSEDFAVQADYFGMVSGKKADKFADTGLTPIRSTLVNAPYIKEFPLVLECKLVHQIELGLHTQFVGEILDVKASEDILDDNGALDVEELKPFFYAPEVSAYYGTGRRLGNAFSIGQAVRKKGK